MTKEDDIMEYIVTIHSIKEISILKNADSFLIGNQKFAVRLNTSFNKMQIKLAKDCCVKLNKKLYVLVNKIMMDQDLESLEKYLLFLKEIEIDGIFFSDFAVFMLAKKYHFDNKLIFYHDTILRSAQDVISYHYIGIPRLVFSKDAHLEDILALNEKDKNMAGLFVQGYFPIYYSKRRVIKHHLKRYHLSLNNKNMFLKEKTRSEFYPILENQNGAIIFNSLPLSYIQEINQLKNHISFIIIDSIFENVHYTEKWLNLYQQAIENNQNVMVEDMSQFTTGFLTKKVGLE